MPKIPRYASPSFTIQCANKEKHASIESRGPVCGEDLLAGAPTNTVRKRKFQVLGEELLDVWAANVIGLLNLNDLEDMNRPETSTVPGSHVLVESLNSICS